MVISTHIIKHERTYQGQIHPTCTYTVFSPPRLQRLQIIQCSALLLTI